MITVKPLLSGLLRPISEAGISVLPSDQGISVKPLTMGIDATGNPVSGKPVFTINWAFGNGQFILFGSGAKITT